MSVDAVHGTREEKLKWLLRPVEWASNVAAFGAVFGFVFWYFEMYGDTTLIVALVAMLALIAGLLIWGSARISNAARGRL